MRNMPAVVERTRFRDRVSAVCDGDAVSSSTSWRAGILWATLDLSASYRAEFDTMLPDALDGADPLHGEKLAKIALDECRCRVQNDTVGHRGGKHDPPYWARRRLVTARERLSGDQHVRRMGLLRTGDPRREV